jgi:hypothetical protein
VPPVYTVAVAAFALGVSDKWLDNLLSRGELPGVIRERQGVGRSISEQGVLAIELVRILGDELGMSTTASKNAVRAVFSRTPSTGEPMIRTASGVELHFPVDSLSRSLRERLRDALEAVPPRKRGRPPGKKKNAER